MSDEQPAEQQKTRVLLEVKLPCSISIVGLVSKALCKKHPGVTMRQIGNHLVFDESIKVKDE